MKLLKYTGLTFFLLALLLLTGMLGTGRYQLPSEDLPVSNPYHRTAILEAVRQQKIDKSNQGGPSSIFEFSKDFKQTLKAAQEIQAKKAAAGIPEGVGEWDFKLGGGAFKEYTLYAAKHAYQGPAIEYRLYFLLLTLGLGALGGILYAIPLFLEIPGIKNNQVYQHSLTRGFRGPLPWLGIFTGIYLIVFYVLLYWTPHYLTPWMVMVDPISEALNGKEASQWFFYGLLYTIVVLVMGIRMIAKYRHNRYQLIRTGSVIFFQTAFAFLIPEILMRLNYPYYDFKNIWPLNYTFFFDWNIQNLLDSGALGVFMLVWGIVLIAIAVPVITYFFGKRWYCSWVCGCGGLAETLGDPFRQLSSKKLSAWKVERWLIHGVLAFAVSMTALVLYTYFSGQGQVLFLNSYTVRDIYGFLIGSIFAGVVGTGFYPFMGSRVWCRFGCPLAAYLGLVQRFKSRFRITTNGGQCISCGNCSTYCEMGIDVRGYAQRGQDIVRASCVGCGVCSAVCPRGVLRLENL